jgi:lipopolysaccharide export LptBFGC system permease protein LptF
MGCSSHRQHFLRKKYLNLEKIETHHDETIQVMDEVLTEEFPTEDIAMDTVDTESKNSEFDFDADQNTNEFRDGEKPIQPNEPYTSNKNQLVYENAPGENKPANVSEPYERTDRTPTEQFEKTFRWFVLFVILALLLTIVTIVFAGLTIGGFSQGLPLVVSCLLAFYSFILTFIFSCISINKSKNIPPEDQDEKLKRRLGLARFFLVFPVLIWIGLLVLFIVMLNSA